MKKWLKRIGLGLIVLLVALQLAPLNRTNPTVTREVKWNAPETRALAQRACFDCHSNETVWPWYAYIAPISMRVVSHTNEGRERLNFSAWDQPNEGIEEMEKAITQGEMPLWDYLIMHPEAKLSDAEKQVLIDGLKATLAADPPMKRERPNRTQ
jgi:cytochrome c551/c552